MSFLSDLKTTVCICQDMEVHVCPVAFTYLIFYTEITRNLVMLKLLHCLVFQFHSSEQSFLKQGVHRCVYILLFI